jgi:hypothetical protein
MADTFNLTQKRYEDLLAAAGSYNGPSAADIADGVVKGIEPAINVVAQRLGELEGRPSPMTQGQLTEALKGFEKTVKVETVRMPSDEELFKAAVAASDEDFNKVAAARLEGKSHWARHGSKYLGAAGVLVATAAGIIIGRVTAPAGVDAEFDAAADAPDLKVMAGGKR